jgi:CheY-like chemotaxis protein
LNELRQPGKAIVKEQVEKQRLQSDFSMYHPLRILIAEDNPVNQQLAIKVLSRLGYAPDTAGNGQEALDMAGNETYDMILMDVQMPEMDGLEATRMIRERLKIQPVIIAMTANAMQGDREECLGAGMDDYITKPVNFEELISMLEKWSTEVKARV